MSRERKKDSSKKSSKPRPNKKRNFFSKAWTFLARKEVYTPFSVIGVIFLILIGWINYGDEIMYSVLRINPLSIEITEDIINVNEDTQFKVYVMNNYKKEVYAEMTIPIANNPNNFKIVCDSLFPPSKSEEYRCNGQNYEDQNFKEGWNLFTFNITIINNSIIKNNTQLCIKLSPIDYNEKKDCTPIVK